jgi:hypothetical protein
MSTASSRWKDLERRRTSSQPSFCMRFFFFFSKGMCVCCWCCLSSPGICPSRTPPHSRRCSVCCAFVLAAWGVHFITTASRGYFRRLLALRCAATSCPSQMFFFGSHHHHHHVTPPIYQSQQHACPSKQPGGSSRALEGEDLAAAAAWGLTGWLRRLGWWPHKSKRHSEEQ